MNALLAYRGTIFVALLSLFFVGLSWTSRGEGSGHDEFTVERGWPLVCWSQDYLDHSHVYTQLRLDDGRVVGEPKKTNYPPQGEARVDWTALGVDVAISLVILIVPAAICVGFTRRSQPAVGVSGSSTPAT